MGESPLISILMPVYNCEPFIEEAVRSILNQTFADFEFLIRDDNSTDKTWEILQQFDDPRIILSRNTVNRGLAANLNELIETSKGELVARMDGDDRCLPERFDLQVKYLQNHPVCGVVGSWYNWIDIEGNGLRTFELPEDDERIRGGLIYNCNTIIHATTIMRASCLREVSGYRPKVGITEDYDLWLRLMDICEFGNITVSLYQYRQHSTQVGSARTREQNAAALMVRLYALERKHSGCDSLDLYTDDQISKIRSGAFLTPLAGSVQQQQAAILELTDVLDQAVLPGELFRVCLASIKRWPLRVFGYSILAKAVLSPRTYTRGIKRVRNCLRAVLGRGH